MNTIHIKAAIHHNGDNQTVIAPVSTPDLIEVRLLAERLHVEGQEYRGMAWGWPAYYDPELREEAAEFQILDEQGEYRTEIRPFRSPASFTIGENKPSPYCDPWQLGRDKPPVEFLDDQALATSFTSKPIQR